MLKLIKLLRRDAEIGAIESEFKQHPSLSVNLLKYLNSAAIGVKTRITSIQHAIALLGHNKLTQWLMLLSFAGPAFDDLENPLLRTAELRGRTMEALAGAFKGDAKMKDAAFMCGMLSLMDVVFQVSKKKILDELNVDDTIREAVLEQKGLLGKLLVLQEAAERDKMELMVETLEQMPISMETFARIYLECMTALERANGGEEKA